MSEHSEYNKNIKLEKHSICFTGVYRLKKPVFKRFKGVVHWAYESKEIISNKITKIAYDCGFTAHDNTEYFCEHHRKMIENLLPKMVWSKL